jgi:hypothetical protein
MERSGAGFTLFYKGSQIGFPNLRELAKAIQTLKARPTFGAPVTGPVVATVEHSTRRQFAAVIRCDQTGCLRLKPDPGISVAGDLVASFLSATRYLLSEPAAVACTVHSFTVRKSPK